MSKFAGILGLAFLVFVFIFTWYLELIALVFGVVLCLTLITGFVWRGHKTRNFWLPGGKGDQGADAPRASAIRVEGLEFLPANLPPRLEFRLEARNIHMLVAIGVIAIGTVAAGLTGARSPLRPTPPDDNLIWYVMSYLLGILLFPAFTWFSESALLRHPAITLAPVTQDQGPAVWVRYYFVDARGEYHGGSTFNLGGPRGDHFKVVFCNPVNPAVNAISCGLVFHKVSWDVLGENP